ncbi:MAG: hypothetical protein KDE27_19330 [Planctomycetes bacterium]|nr:hypothetical protein [Planctomycetota bacterium]
MSRSAAAAAAAAALVGVLAAFTAAGCVPSNVVARSDRMVATAVDELEFGPADALRLDGFWVTERVTGEVAVALRWVGYWFADDGSYTAAAMIQIGDGVEFQTRNGTWQLGPDGLALDGAAPVTTELAGDFVRLTTPDGQLVLRRERLE